MGGRKRDEEGLKKVFIRLIHQSQILRLLTKKETKKARKE